MEQEGQAIILFYNGTVPLSQAELCLTALPCTNRFCGGVVEK